MEFYLHGILSTGDGVIILAQNKQSLAVGKVISNSSPQNLESVLVNIMVSMIKTVPPLEGKCLWWPKSLIAKPVRLALTNPNTLHAPETSSQTLPVPVSELPTNGEEDRILNYGLQILQLGVFLMQLDDTEREGDGQRMMRNWKMLLLFNRAAKRGKKYAYEAMRLITNCHALYSEKKSHRIINGMFVNPSGGEGNNYANDLKQEHIVKANKVSLSDLRGNKTLKAVTRSTQAS